MSRFLLQKAKQSSLAISQRSFAVAAEASSTQQDPSNQQQKGAAPIFEKPISHTLRNQHIRFVPKNRLDFKTSTPDGKISMVYKSGPRKRFNLWDAWLAMSLPAIYSLPMILPPEPMLLTCTAFLLPSMSLYALFDRSMRRGRRAMDVDEIHLFDNGEQLLIKTHDGVLHKLDILYNDNHRFSENKDGSLIFIMENGNRDYYIQSKEAEQIDYQILDKLIRAICIDTSRTQNQYHRLVSRQTPANLRPSQFYRHVPHWSFQSVESSVFIWKYLNRTIYRSPNFEGADASFLWHLRNKRGELNQEEKALREEFGIKIVYPADLFYKTHKITQIDFLAKLRDAGSDAEVQKIADSLFDDDSICGRRGVKPLKDGVALVKNKIANKQRMKRFAQKVSGNQEGMSFQQLRQSGILKSSQMF